MNMEVRPILVLMGMGVDLERLAKGPDPDANQQDSNKPLAPAADQIHGQQLTQDQRQNPHKPDAGRVPDAPTKSGHPSVPATAQGERSDSREMIGAGQNMN